MNICDVFTDVHRKFVGRPFLKFSADQFSLDSFLKGLTISAGLLRTHGVGPGDRVLLLAKNRPEWLTACFSVLSMGAIVVPVNPALTKSEIAHIVRDSGPIVAIVDDELVGTVESNDACLRVVSTRLFCIPSALSIEGSNGSNINWFNCSSTDAALIIYTSGTTGKPKGAVLSHAGVLHTVQMEAEHFLISSSDSTIVLGPLSFLYPLVVNFLSCLAGGASVVLPERFHPKEILESIQHHQVTIMMGVPTMYIMMCNFDGMKDAKLRSLRLCVAAGAVLGPSVVARFAERFGVQLYDLWGLTEATPLTGYDLRVDKSVRPESCGRALPGVQIQVVDDSGHKIAFGEIGEIWAKTPSCMLGYYNNPSATAATVEDGWLQTGDLGKITNDGYLYIVGRKKDLIIRGGANIYPAEIEEVLFKMPDTAECAVVGVPHDIYGETVKAFIVRKPGSSVSQAQFEEFCRTQLAEYKVPAEFAFVQELPKGPTGKILKRLLKSSAA